MNTTKLNAVLTNAVASGAAAGIAAAITTGAETIFQATAGVTALNTPQPITPDTMFWIASMTKPLTSIAALQLVEQNKLSLDAPIGDLLPDLANPNVLENGQLRPARTKITLRHLLTHTSGFSYAFTSPALTAYIAANNITIPPGALASLNSPLICEPGTRWEYGISTDWVGRAVEAASGETLNDYFTNHITGPLNMADTVFIPSAEQKTRRAAIHQRQPDGSLAPQPPAPRTAPDFFSGGGGLLSTLTDYQKFTRMILQGGAGIVSPATIAALSTNQIGPLRAGILTSADPTQPAADLFPGIDTKWSFAFLVLPQPGPFGRGAGSLSWSGIANTHFWIDPAKNIAAILLMQVLPAGDKPAIKTLLQFESAVYAALQ